MSFSTPYRLPRPRMAKPPAQLSKKWLDKPDVIVEDDGREICNPRTPGGKGEYRLRIFFMWVRQSGLCCNCRKKLSLGNATFEHEIARTKARQDDRIAIFDEAGKLVRLINGASHRYCNNVRGSRRTPIWHGDSTLELMGILPKGEDYQCHLLTTKSMS